MSTPKSYPIYRRGDHFDMLQYANAKIIIGVVGFIKKIIWKCCQQIGNLEGQQFMYNENKFAMMSIAMRQ